MARTDRPGAPDIGTQRAQRKEAHANQSYGVFLKQLSSIGNYSREDAERYASSVLCALEQRITAEEAHDLEAQLPVRLTELLVRCHRHAGIPPRRFGRDEFMQMVAEDLSLDVSQVEPIVRNVFTTVGSQISVGEFDDVASQLPKDLQDLWRRPT